MGGGTGDEESPDPDALPYADPEWGGAECGGERRGGRGWREGLSREEDAAN